MKGTLKGEITSTHIFENNATSLLLSFQNSDLGYNSDICAASYGHKRLKKTLSSSIQTFKQLLLLLLLLSLLLLSSSS